MSAKPRYTPNKFIVVNPEHVRKAPAVLQQAFTNALNNLKEYLPAHEYYVCNADEIYADDVIAVIMDGEREKAGYVDIAVATEGNPEEAADADADMDEAEDADDQENGEDTPAAQ